MERKVFIWWRDLLVIPLIVGSIVAFFAFLLPKFLDKNKELSYTINKPFQYLNKAMNPRLRDVPIKVKDIPVRKLIAYAVKLWNSGDFPLKNLNVRVIFNTDNDDLEFFNITHVTKPRHEFGKLSEKSVDNFTILFNYELLNPGDEDEIMFLTNDTADIEVYSKLEGMKLKWVKIPKTSPDFVLGLIAVSIAASLITGILSILRLRIVYRKKIKKV